MLILYTYIDYIEKQFKAETPNYIIHFSFIPDA